MTKKPKNLKRSLQAHRQIEKNYRLGVRFSAGLVVLVAVLLALGIMWSWPPFLVLALGIGVITTLIGLLGEAGKLSERRKIIANTIAQIENAQHDAAQDGESAGAPSPPVS